MKCCAVCGEPAATITRDDDGDAVCVECATAIARYAAMTDAHWRRYIASLAALVRLAEGVA